jgi:hypothetical protein
MNGKFILLAIICMNVVLLSFASVTSIQEDFTLANNPIVSIYSFSSAEDLDTQGQPQFTGEFNDAVTTALTPNAAGVAPIQGIQTFIDVIQLIIAFLGLLTPLPILAFVYSLGVAWTLNALIMLPIVLLYMLSMVEFIRGGSF